MADIDHITGRVWRDGRLLSEEIALDDLDELLSTDGILVWLDICEPSAAVLERLRLELGLDPLAIEDAVSAAERPKATVHRTHTFVTVYSATLSDPVGWEPHRSQLVTHRISAFVLPRGLVTIRLDDVEHGGFDLNPVMRRWDADLDLLTTGPSGLVYGLLDAVVDEHFEVVQTLDDRIEVLEGRLFDESAEQRALQQDLYGMRKQLVDLRRVVLPMREVVGAIVRHGVGTSDDERHVLQPLYQDLYDHVLRASEWTDSLRDMVTTIFETNLSLADARMNTIMKKLAGWAAIIAVPTLITGWFGQNVPYPGYDQMMGFWLSLGLCLVCSLVLYMLFKKHDWV